MSAPRLFFAIAALMIAFAPSAGAQQPPELPPPPLPPPASDPTAALPPIAAVPTTPTLPPAPTQQPGYGAWMPPTVQLDLSVSEPGAGFELYPRSASPGRDQPIATCPSDCRLFVVPGEYHIRVTETEETRAGHRTLQVDRPMAISFDPDTKLKKTVGLVLGITGPILMLAGVGILLGDPVCGEYDGSSGSCDKSEGERMAGLTLAIGGLAATPIGWVMFGTSFKPEYEISTPVPAR